MSDFDYTEGLIDRYKRLKQQPSARLTQEEAMELLSIFMFLTKRGFTVTADGDDWMPPFTPAAE